MFFLSTKVAKNLQYCARSLATFAVKTVTNQYTQTYVVNIKSSVELDQGIIKVIDNLCLEPVVQSFTSNSLTQPEAIEHNLAIFAKNSDTGEETSYFVKAAIDDFWLNVYMHKFFIGAVDQDVS